MDWRQATMLLHDIGTAWAVGSATITMILMFKADRDEGLAATMAKITPMLNKLVMIGMVILIASGVALIFLVDRSIDDTMLVVKIVVVVALVLNGLNLNLRMQPQATKLAPKEGEKPSDAYTYAKKNVKLGILTSVVLLYAILILSVML